MSRSSSARRTIRCFPAQSFDRVFLVHMYHEVESPYAFLWHLRDGVKPDGLVIVVDSDRPVKQHGIPPAQLKCEFAALGPAAGEVQRADRRRSLSHGVPRRGAEARAGKNQAAFAKRLEQPSPPEAGALVAREHEMVEHGAVERFGSGRQAAGRAAIRSLGRVSPLG